MGRENYLQQAWDEVAPLTEDQDAIDEDLQMDNGAAEPYDIGQDLGLPAQVMANSIQSITVMPYEEYRDRWEHWIGNSQSLQWMSCIMLKLQITNMKIFVWWIWSWKNTCCNVTFPIIVQIFE